MQASDIPAQKFPVPFGSSATGSYIRVVPETTTDPNAASLVLGWPPNTGTPVGAGGSPPDIRDANGILYQTTAWTRWQNAGGPVFYDSAFSADVGGYPAGAILASTITVGLIWINLVDNNTNDPDSVSTNWWPFNLLTAGVPTGTVHWFARSTPPTGYLECNGASLARAGTYAALFAVIGVTFGAADGSHFNLPDLRGQFVRGWDDGAGVDPGRTFGTNQADAFKSHTHTATTWGNSGVNFFGHGGTADPPQQPDNVTNATGGTETRPVNVALLFCIKI